MTEKRTNKVIIVCGTKNTGKTTFVRELMLKFPQSKILVVDTIIHPSYEDFGQPVDSARLAKWKPPKTSTEKSLVRVQMRDLDETLHNISEYVSNTVVIFEDATKFLRGGLNGIMRNIILDCKQKNDDIILLFHSLNSVPPELFENADILILKLTQETEQKLRKIDKIPCFDEVLDAYRELQTENTAHGNRYGYKTIYFS